jgi:hypothetical protein
MDLRNVTIRDCERKARNGEMVLISAGIVTGFTKRTPENARYYRAKEKEEGLR